MRLGGGSPTLHNTIACSDPPAMNSRRIRHLTPQRLTLLDGVDMLAGIEGGPMIVGADPSKAALGRTSTAVAPRAEPRLPQLRRLQGAGPVSEAARAQRAQKASDYRRLLREKALTDPGEAADRVPSEPPPAVLRLPRAPCHTTTPPLPPIPEGADVDGDMGHTTVSDDDCIVDTPKEARVSFREEEAEPVTAPVPSPHPPPHPVSLSRPDRNDDPHDPHDPRPLRSGQERSPQRLPQSASDDRSDWPVNVRYGPQRREDRGSEFYWELEFDKSSAAYDSDPFVFGHMMWRFSLQLRPSRRYYQVQVCLMSPATGPLELACEFKVHCMLRPPYVRRPARRFLVGPGRPKCAGVSDFISTVEIQKCVSNGRVLISGRLWLAPATEAGSAAVCIEE